MGKTVLCENCRSTFRESVLADRDDPDTCPVCGASLLGDCADMENIISAETDDDDDILMYFTEINKDTKPNNVEVYCRYCKESYWIGFDKFDKLVDGKYVLLKKGVVLKCSECGEEHYSRRILYKKKNPYPPLLPHCPVCNSIMLKKISTGSKFLAAATMGAFALPYNTKTYECQNCGYMF